MTRQLIFHVETVTPIFLGGTQARELAETVRPASIRGQVRYWLRALLGSAVAPGSNALEQVKTREGHLMGDTEAGSPVRFRVRRPATSERPLNEWTTASRHMLPHKAIHDESRAFATNAFAEEQRFDIILSPRPGRTTIPDEVVAATLLWLHLGGLGKRARRGFGSLQLLSYTASEGLISEEAREQLPDGRPAGADALRGRISAFLAWMAGAGPQPAGAWGTSPLPDYSILHPDVAGVRVSEPVTGYFSQPAGYHEAMVPFWEHSLREDGLRDKFAYGYATRHNRRASPFHLHIARTEAGYHQVFTTFWAGNPPPDNRREQEAVPSTINWAKVGALLADVETKFGATNLWGRAS